MDKQTLEQAWDILDSTPLSRSQKNRVANTYIRALKDEYPFIATCYGNGEYYRSTHSAINHLHFSKLSEVILANALYENLKDNFNPNDFVQQLKFSFRLLNIENEWTT